MYYYYHPESDSLWRQTIKEDLTTLDGHLVELTKEEAEDLAKELGLQTIPTEK